LGNEPADVEDHHAADPGAFHPFEVGRNASRLIMAVIPVPVNVGRAVSGDWKVLFPGSRLRRPSAKIRSASENIAKHWKPATGG